MKGPEEKSRGWVGLPRGYSGTELRRRRCGRGLGGEDVGQGGREGDGAREQPGAEEERRQGAGQEALGSAQGA